MVWDEGSTGCERGECEGVECEGVECEGVIREGRSVTKKCEECEEGV